MSKETYELEEQCKVTVPDSEADLQEKIQIHKDSYEETEEIAKAETGWYEETMNEMRYDMNYGNPWD